jgi:hypothetical protein
MSNLSLDDLSRLRPSSVIRRRISSYATDFTNFDFIIIQRNSKKVIADISGAGCIKHIWFTIQNSDKNHLRKVVIRMFWDNENTPSIEVPIGDFFGIGHGLRKNYWCLPLSMGPEDGQSYNCWWPMPFATHARIEIDNDTKRSSTFYYHIDYEEYDKLPEDQGRFHAQWRRCNPCQGFVEEVPRDVLNTIKNTDFSKNYVILEAEGKGHYVGCNLNIHNLRIVEGYNWPGEGDDMTFIDDDPSKTIYGTGTEELFGTAWSPTQEFYTPYYGIIYPGGKNHSGKITYYRYHILDPIYFTKKIKVTIEHGHANGRSDDYSSTAYWYQTEPHKPFPPLLATDDRIPRSEPKEIL